MREEGIEPQRQQGAKGTGCWGWGPGWLSAGGGQGARGGIASGQGLCGPSPSCTSSPQQGSPRKGGCSVPPASAPEGIPQPSSEPGLPCLGPRGHIYHPLTLSGTRGESCLLSPLSLFGALTFGSDMCLQMR